jgi:2-polyprenyl-3-methyl-5-hydroxy-6-metoxy-1,4-benzoquinol methylase
MTLAERDGLNILSKEVDLVNVQEKTNIPIPLLSGLLDLLTEGKFVIRNGDFYRFSYKILESPQFPKNISLLRTNYGQAFNMITSAREDNMVMGWSHTQEYLLQAQGDNSEKIVTHVFEQFDIVKSAIEQCNATLLDVGAGVCGISIKACEQYPNLNVVGLEPSEEPYKLGKQNILLKGFEKRIQLRKLFLEDLHDVEKYDVIWLPQAFIPEDVFSKCLLNIKKALKQNGVLVTHIMSTSKPGVGSSIGRLKNILFGGSLRSCEKLLQDLENIGLYDLQTQEDNSGIAIAGMINKYHVS